MTRGRRGTRSVATERFRTFQMFVLLNFGLFVISSSLLGGDALNGTIVGDAYFLRNHGRYTEVGVGVWLYSLVHTCVTLLSFVAMMVVWLVGVFTGKIEVYVNDDELHPRGRGTV